MKKLFLFLSLLSCLFFLTECKKENKTQYGLTQQNIYSSAHEKTKLKTDQQFISVLYSNLFQKNISQGKANAIEQLVRSIGDKSLAYELIVSDFMNDPDVIIPTPETMRSDIPKFVDETFSRFYLRQPTEAEKQYFINFIETNSTITPELIYISFSTSDEYHYY
jgi:hypothetical protein